MISTLLISALTAVAAASSGAPAIQTAYVSAAHSWAASVPAVSPQESPAPATDAPQESAPVAPQESPAPATDAPQESGGHCYEDQPCWDACHGQGTIGRRYLSDPATRSWWTRPGDPADMVHVLTDHGTTCAVTVIDGIGEPYRTGHIGPQE